MNKFSSKLTQVFKKYDVNIYKLSQSIGVDRSTIQHIKSGKRLPPYSFVESVCSVVPVSLSEKQELFKDYSITKTGSKSYYERLEVKRLLESTILDFNKIEFDSISSQSNSISVEALTTSPITKNKYAVLKKLNEITKHEINNYDNPKFYLSIPCKKKNLLGNLLSNCMYSDKKIDIEHYMRLYSGDCDVTQNDNNIFFLKSALRLAMSNKNGTYTPYYYFVSKDVTYDVFPAFPFYLITSDYLILFSLDCDSAWVIDDKTIRDVFISHCKLIQKNARPLIDRMNEMDYIKTFESDSLNSTVVTLESDPCIAQYISLNYIEKYIVEDAVNREKIIELCEKIYNPYSIDNIFKYTSYFTISGLDSFVRTGRLSYFPSSLVKPIDVADRIIVLKRMKQDIDNFKLIDSSKFIISDNISADLLADRSMVLSINNNGVIHYCKINDVSLSEPFFDFIKYDLDEYMIIEQSELLKIIDGYIELCKNI